MEPVAESRILKPFGVEVSLDLSRPLDARDQAALASLLARHKLLVFRGQKLAPEDQLRVMSYFGAVLPPEREHRELALDGDFGRSRIAYHSDLLFTAAPYQRLSLFAIEVDEGRTATRFVNGVHAAATLPPELRERIATMDAISVVPITQTHRELAWEPPAGLTHSRHPVLVTHPLTGETILSVTEMQTARIGELPPAESETLLTELFRHLYAPGGVHEHVWRQGDFVLWDNLALQHGRDDQAGVRVRRLRRVVGAELSFYDLCPEFVMGDARIEQWGEGNPLSLS